VTRIVKKLEDSCDKLPTVIASLHQSLQSFANGLLFRVDLAEVTKESFILP
jgi:hypothetical protein